MNTIPFLSNTPDGMHCFQAALGMALGHFEGVMRPMSELIALSQKLPGKWTWPTATLLWLLENGFEICLMEEFDYQSFGKTGKKYLVKRYGPEVADAQEAHSDLAREQALALEFVGRAKKALQFKVPTLKDLGRLLDQGYIIICNVNACSLYGQAGYSGHFVVPLFVAPTHVLLHDPGLPPKPSIRISTPFFEKGCGYPTASEKNLLAVRKRQARDPSTRPAKA